MTSFNTWLLWFYSQTAVGAGLAYIFLSMRYLELFVWFAPTVIVGTLLSARMTEDSVSRILSGCGGGDE